MADYLRVLARGWRTVAIGALLGIVLVVAANLLTPPRFSSETTLYLATAVAPGSSSGAYDGGLAAQQKAASYVPLLGGPTFAGEVARRANISEDAASSSVTATVEPDTPVVRITATGTTPLDAQELAQVASEAALDVVAEVERAQSPLPVVVARVAQPPSSGESGGWGLTTVVLLGLVLGTAAGVVAALARDAADRTVRGEAELALLVGRPVLGSIPYDRKFRNCPLIGDCGLQSDRAEAFRQVRTSLGFLPGRQRRIVLAVAGPVAREGRTTLTGSLATVLGQAGRSVVVVGSDLRAPRLEDYLHVHDSPGLSGALADPAGPWSAIRHVDHGPFDFLPAGTVPQYPSEVLGSPRMPELVQLLSARYEVVLLDTPPILSVTDAAVVGTLASGVLLVVGMGRSTSTEVERSVDLLRQAGVPVLGSVLTMARPAGRSVAPAGGTPRKDVAGEPFGAAPRQPFRAPGRSLPPRQPPIRTPEVSHSIPQERRPRSVPAPAEPAPQSPDRGGTDRLTDADRPPERSSDPVPSPEDGTSDLPETDAGSRTDGAVDRSGGAATVSAVGGSSAEHTACHER